MPRKEPDLSLFFSLLMRTVWADRWGRAADRSPL